MCGRFTLRAPTSVVAQQFALFEISPLVPRFNIAPAQMVAVVRQAGAAASGRELVWMRWGLVPAWAKNPSIGNRMINARAETVAEKPAYRGPLRQRRCLVPADGFYEWQREGRAKQPYFFRLPGDALFALAGLWEVWLGPQEQHLESCVILTTEANDLVWPIHDRMPVILPPESYALWLDPNLTQPAPLFPLLRPYPAQAMEAHPVSSRVNTPTNDDPRCVAPTVPSTLF